MAVDGSTLRDALARFASGVTVVTTVDRAARPWGFTASAFTSLSLSPPLVLVCLDRGADCYRAFLDADGFVVNVLRPEHEALARRFAAKGVDRFVGGEFEAGWLGLPVLREALAVVECRTVDRAPGGDHTIFIGAVQAARAGEGEPLVYFNRAFRRLANPADVTVHAGGRG